jgi:hypothetical protein
VFRANICTKQHYLDLSFAHGVKALIWWIIIPAVAVAALAYAFWDHRNQSNRLVTLFTPIAEAYGGSVKPATVLALPQLRFEHEGRNYFIGAMANAGNRVSGSASRPGFTGAFSFANVEIEHDTGQDMNILRTDRLDRAAIRVIGSVSNSTLTTSGDTAFDKAFRIKSNDRAFAKHILTQELRQMLLNSPQQRLEVALKGPKISVHIDDYVKSAAQLDEMIGIVTLLAENCKTP